MLREKPGFLFAILMLIFVVPLYGAWLLFTHHPDWIQKTTNHGSLVQPVLPLQNLPLSEYNSNNSFNTARWKSNWVLLYMKGDNCDQRCLRALYEINQIQKATGKYQDKILTAYVAIDPSLQTNPSAETLRQFPRTILLKASSRALNPFFKNPSLTETIASTGQIFLVDPSGYVMMRYDSDADPENIYHDLDHLLGLGGM